ncbi:hypothetical protein [Labrenzia sp. 011]|uniref:hypothetical protein n=1 Tax=Labrenzia sp. 011 TaxID=2171494 RepID=UPI000D506BDC|nr:hypothetical protein [Labrenzia sp. 011]PVB59313.1 hypothetical protein DCO57_22735 [Labrenzia sp. 011]
MDELIMRRLKHLQRLEENHEQDFQARRGDRGSSPEERHAALCDALSADWNRKRKGAGSSAQPQALPKGWRKEHWKTQQAMAAHYAGVKAANKQEAVQALTAYEARLAGNAAA